MIVVMDGILYKVWGWVGFEVWMVSEYDFIVGGGRRRLLLVCGDV